jgi:hypothetical protein
MSDGRTDAAALEVCTCNGWIQLAPGDWRRCRLPHVDVDDAETRPLPPFSAHPLFWAVVAGVVRFGATELRTRALEAIGDRFTAGTP